MYVVVWYVYCAVWCYVYYEYGVCVCVYVGYHYSCYSPQLPQTLDPFFLPSLLLLFSPLLHVAHNLLILLVDLAGLFGHALLGQATDLWHKRKQEERIQAGFFLLPNWVPSAALGTS